MKLRSALWVVATCLATVFCGGTPEPGDHGTAGRRGPGGGEGRRGGSGGAPPAAAVPVEIETVGRRSIASYLETNGTLEAEKDVEIVARVAGLVTELVAEEGMKVSAGQLLARIDETELRAQVEIARVRLKEAERNFARAESSKANELISEETYEQVLSARESAQAELVGRQILLDFAAIEAPFSG